MDLTEADMRCYMEQCIELARKSNGIIDPPLVGALVLAPNGEIVGEGYRSFLDRKTTMILHAERMALDAAENKAKGATLFTTLEPCARQGGSKIIFKPCSELIVERGISRVVFGRYDYNPNYPGGSAYLRNRGVETVFYGDLESDIIRHNIADCPRVRRIRPPTYFDL